MPRLIPKSRRQRTRLRRVAHGQLPYPLPHAAAHSPVYSEEFWGLPSLLFRIWVDEEISVFWFPDSRGSLQSLLSHCGHGGVLAFLHPPSASQLRCSLLLPRVHCPSCLDWSALSVMMSTAPLVFSKWLRSKTAFFHACMFWTQHHEKQWHRVDRETELDSDKTLVLTSRDFLAAEQDAGLS